MLTAEENELYTRVGPGTAMGSLLRRYWLPALLSEELAENDGAPVEVELLGEKFVAFRDTEGRVGLLQERCPHRGAALVFGRNEDAGLRCIFHGWKFDVSGQCTDMPTEPESSGLRARVRARAYPVREAGGIVWAFLGPTDRMPPFPELPWLTLSPSHSRTWKVLQECNYAQSIERDLNRAHVPIAHKRLTDEERRAGARLTDFDSTLTMPRVEVQPTKHGFRYATIYDADQNSNVRVGCYLLPCYLVLGPIDGHRVALASVPKDDYNNWHFISRYNEREPVDAERYAATRGLNELDASRRKLRNISNAYLQDREAMKTVSFNGIQGVIVEDHALAEIQGPIVDRTQEVLGASDAAIVALRNLLLENARGLMEEREPLGLEPMPFAQIAGVDLLVEPGTPWQEACPLDPALRP